MTLSEKYDKIMSRVEVTPEMRQRILRNIAEADVNKTSKVTHFPHWKRYISIAACFAIILTASLAIPSLLNQRVIDTNPPIVGVESIYECASIDELSQMVGFSVSNLTELPFEIERTTYTSYFGELAQISYEGINGESAVYRKSIGTEDNSGNYDNFADVQEVSMDAFTATLKGADGAYKMALWTEDGYSYSLWLSDGVSEDEWKAIFINIIM